MNPKDPLHLHPPYLLLVVAVAPVVGILVEGAHLLVLEMMKVESYR